MGGGGGVDGGHEAFDDAELVVEDLGERSQAVGGAGGVGDDLGALGIVGLEVDTADEHRSVSGRSSDDDLLGTTLDVSVGLVHGGEDTGGLDNVVDASLAPRDGRGVLVGFRFNVGLP